jgi:hypothetical protein
MTCVVSNERRSTLRRSRSLIHFATKVQNGRSTENEDLRILCSRNLEIFKGRAPVQRSRPPRRSLEPAKTCNAPHLRKKSLEKKTPRKDVSILVPIGADMDQMRDPTWILWTFLTDVQIRRGLPIVDRYLESAFASIRFVLSKPFEFFDIPIVQGRYLQSRVSCASYAYTSACSVRRVSGVFKV